MSQASLDDDELFGEAASEMRADVEELLAAAWAALPDADEIWTADGDNVLGVLNGLKTALDAGDAADHLRDAKKWYTMGVRAEAFDDADDLEAEMEALEGAIADLESAAEQVGELTATIPTLRGTLEDAGGEDVTDDEAATEAEAEAD